MKQHLVNSFGAPIKFINDPHNQRRLVISSFVILFSCLLFLLFGRSTDHSDIVSTESMTSTLIYPTPAMTSTKWWIKMSSTTTPPHPSEMANLTDSGTFTSNCPKSLSSPLRPGIYAYISLDPPFPNRIRSGAGKAYTYLGQIEPGAGVRVIEGPLCSDHLSWWLVESTKDGLRGWTAEGKETEQWVTPCPDQKVACNKKPAPTQASPSMTPSSSMDQDKNKNEMCRSDKLAVGILAQVHQDSILVIRSEPNTGNVIGRSGPLSVVSIVDGPTCTGNAIWFKVKIAELNLLGWATENSLHACSKEDVCY